VGNLESPRLAARLARVGLISAAIAVFFWQLGNPIIRFSLPFLNYVVGWALALVLPWLAHDMVRRLGRWWAKGAAVIIGVLLIPYSLIVLLGSAMTVLVFKGGHDLSFDQFSDSPWKGTAVRLYRTNFGATTAYGVVIRQERTVFPGIMLVRTLDTFDHCYSLDVTTAEHGIRVEDMHSYCSGFSGRYQDYRLRRFVYF
jgi:hypothetical protein